ncbi:hypothetical protein [Ekhidna sp.]|uniref:hypothetical protein n=1 Tax=Ekhidna sp. TaxID=2608089 RepID=UPI003C7B9737
MIYLISVFILSVLGIMVYNHLSGKNLIRDFAHFVVIRRKSLKNLDEAWSKSNDRSEIILSLTTIPERIDHIQPTIKCLLHQRRLPQKICINIPFKSFRNNKEYIIPTWLTELMAVEIVRVDQDYGPATKFIPTLDSATQDQLILVVDDDKMYPPNYVNEFERTEKEHPECILAASGWRVPKDLIDKPTTLRSNLLKIPPTPVKGTRIKDLYKTDIIQGYSGYLIKPKFFDLDTIKDYSDAPEQIKFVDDIWISAHSKVDKFVLPLKRYCYTSPVNQSFFKSTSLAKINNWNRNNADRNNTVALKYFKDKW